MRLEALLKGVDFDTVCGTLDKEAGTLIYHSDKSSPDAVFFAIRGEKTDGHQFTEKAAEKGVRIFVVEDSNGNFPDGATVLKVKDARQTLAAASRNFFGKPDEGLTMIGITGTKVERMLC